MVILTPKGYFGGNWIGSITTYSQYLNARDFRRWKKRDIKQRNVFIFIKPDRKTFDIDTIYFYPPPVILHRDCNEPMPDVKQMHPDRQRSRLPPTPLDLTYETHMVT